MRDANNWVMRPPSSDDLWLFSVVFDYGEHDINSPKSVGNVPWLGRKDPFSTIRSRFDIRTYRLCRRILMFHHFPELGNEDYLVSIDLMYDHNPYATYLKSATHVGYIFKDNNYVTPLIPRFLEYLQRILFFVQIISFSQGSVSSRINTRMQYCSLANMGL